MATRPDEKIVDQSARNADQSFRKTSRATSEEIKQAAQLAAGASEHAARASAEIVHGSAEMLQQYWMLGSKLTAKLAEQTANQFSRTVGISGDGSGDAAQKSSTNMEAIAGSTAVVAEGIHNMSREWMEFAQTRMQHNLERLNALASCRTAQEFAAVQSELIRDNLEGMLQSARRTAEISTRMADDAMKNMAKRVDQTRSAA
jgi:phasin family protein